MIKRSRKSIGLSLMLVGLLMAVTSWLVLAAVPFFRGYFYREGWKLWWDNQGEMQIALVPGHYTSGYFVCVALLTAAGLAGFTIGFLAFRSESFQRAKFRQSEIKT